jgi:endonuclease/exonuclease/phosphatase family metal-dependent hydrolase
MREGFRVVTYNIHKCKGLDLRTSPMRIADVLRELDADIIALQEVVASNHGRREDDQARFLADELGLDLYLGENRLHRGGLYGNAVLTKLRVTDQRNFDISVPGREKRGCLHVDIQLPDLSKIHIYNLHLGTAFFERRKQVMRLMDHGILRREYPAPRVMLGDFNEYTHGLTSRLMKSHFRSKDVREQLPRRRTYPGVLPILHLDHIYYDHHLELSNAFVHRTRTSLVASDHLPLVADFKITG